MVFRLDRILDAFRGGPGDTGRTEARSEATPESRADIATRPVDDFLTVQTPADMPRERSCRIFGPPMHSTRSVTLRRYTSDPLDSFLAREARHSIGNYLLVDTGPGFCRIVTAPGFCGGYFLARDGVFAAGTLLAPVLSHMPGGVEMDPFGLCFFLSRAPQSNFNQLPFSTMFRDLYRLPPGAVLEFRNGEVTANYSYMTRSPRLEPPRSFESAIKEISDRLGDHYQRTGADEVGVMFSGGVDSLIVYLALRRTFPADKIRCFTVEHSKSNGPERAWPIARHLGFDLEVIPESTWAETEVKQATVDMMRRDLVGTRSPHMALLGKELQGLDLLHGQNMDALVNIHMEVLQANLELAYLSRSKVRTVKSLEGNNRQYTAFIGNLQFTDQYLEDVGFQRLSLDFYAQQHAPAEPDPEPGPEGNLRGMISHQFPNLLSPGDYPQDQMSHLDREVALFRDHAGETLSPRMALDMIRYLAYCHLAGKRLATLPVGEGDTRPVLMAMSGPLLSYYLGKSRTMRDASMPKREVYGLTAKLAGQSYRKLTAGRGPNVKRERNLSSMGDIIQENQPMLKTARSRVLAAIGDAETMSYVRPIYEAINRGDDQPRPTNFQLGQGVKLLNLELVLETADRLRAERAAAAK